MQNAQQENGKTILQRIVEEYLKERDRWHSEYEIEFEKEIDEYLSNDNELKINENE